MQPSSSWIMFGQSQNMRCSNGAWIGKLMTPIPVRLALSICCFVGVL